MMPLPLIHMPAGLPPVDDVTREHGRRVRNMLTQRITDASGWLPFEHWMQAVLYEPGLGYYSAGSVKLHHDGDFTTAPETSPLFGQALARQVAEILRASQSSTVLEFGAGSGALASALIPALRDLGMNVDYRILELSADLRARQREHLSAWGNQVQWLDALPHAFAGCIVANEVLDAMPAILFQWTEAGTPALLGVATDARPDAPAPFRWVLHDAPPVTAAAIAARMPPLPGYRSELNLQAEAWVRNLGMWLEKGAALLIDYGFPRHEYYHPQRTQGTLMCHFRHHAHDQPLVLAGLQDITAHVDFTAMADAALDGGLDVLGYTSQARFLMNAGLTDLIRAPGEEPALRARQLTALNTLLSEAEMGELFKVLAVGRGIASPLLGFARGDRRDRL